MGEAIGAAITGVGVFIPPNRISNEELVGAYNAFVKADEARRIMLGMPPLAHSDAAFIVQESGIQARFVYESKGLLEPAILCPRIAERPDHELSVQAEFAVASARQAIHSAGLEASDIDLVICACAQQQRPYPAIAIEIQKTLGCIGAAFDMNVACSSTVFALHLAAQLVRTGSVRNVLVCSPEIMSGHVNYRDRNTHFIFGDASAAVVVSSTENWDRQESSFGPKYEILATDIWTSFSSNIRSNFGFLNRTAPETAAAPDKLVTQDGNKVFKDIVVFVGRRIRWFLDRNAVAPADIHRFWLHQANLKLIRALTRYIDAAIEPDRVPIVLDQIGNVASPSVIVAFQLTSGAVPVGGLGLMSSFGAGYSAGCLLLKRIS